MAPEEGLGVLPTRAARLLSSPGQARIPWIYPGSPQTRSSRGTTTIIYREAEGGRKRRREGGQLGRKRRRRGAAGWRLGRRALESLAAALEGEGGELWVGGHRVLTPKERGLRREATPETGGEGEEEE